MKELKKASIITMEEESSQKDHNSHRAAPDGGCEGVHREGEDFGAVTSKRYQR
jgi:hypothetical protein